MNADDDKHGDSFSGAEALDPRRLRYFVAVAEEMHFGRAADRLGIAQPPLSRQIVRLETDIGAQLIDRSRSQIRLTQAGATLFERARDLMRQAEELRKEVAWDAIGSEFGGRHELYERNYAGNYENIRIETMLAAMATGDLDRMKGYGKTCMSEYDIDGWTGSDLINPDDVNVIRRGLVKQM